MMNVSIYPTDSVTVCTHQGRKTFRTDALIAAPDAGDIVCNKMFSLVRQPPNKTGVPFKDTPVRVLRVPASLGEARPETTYFGVAASTR